jgi:hypothetical protein
VRALSLDDLPQISLIIPFQFVKRAVSEGVANAKQASVLCDLLHNTGLIARYPSRSSDDGTRRALATTPPALRRTLSN